MGTARLAVPVTGERAAALAAAVGDRCWDPDGDAAPALLGLALAQPAVAAIVGDGVAVAVEHRVAVRRPLRLRTPATVAADLTAVVPDGRGAVLAVGATVTGATGEPAADLTAVVRVADAAGRPPAGDVPPAPPPPARGGLLGEATAVLDAGRLRAWEQAAGGTTAGGTTAGGPGVLVLAVAACAAAGRAGVRAVAGRLAAPVAEGTELTLAWYATDRDGMVGLTAATPEGPVLRRAWARLGG
jgi:hypothetical protein